MTDGRAELVTQRRDEAVALMQQSFPGLRLQIVDDGLPFAFRHATTRIGPLTLNELQISGTSTAEGVMPGVIAAGVLSRGRFDVQYARHRLDTTRPFLRPAEQARLWMRDVHLRMIAFDLDAFRAAADRYADGPRRGLLRTGPATAEGEAAWRWTADRIHEAAASPATQANPVLVDGLFDLGVRMLLACFGEAAGSSPSTVRASPAAVRRAVAYLEEHASGSVTVPEVAAAARVSPRSLQALFRRHLGTTPLGHLHAIRLDAARRDLLGADERSPGIVHEIGLRWGFGNSGRFARLYAERFGERPSETLRQH